MLYYSLVIKLLVGMVAILIFLRMTGKTQMANLTPLDSVNTIILGALVGSIIYMPDTRVWVFIFAITVWTIINMIVRTLLKINFFNRLIHGHADVLIKDGKINIQALKRNNLDINQLRSKLRESEIYSLLDVNEVRFETDGAFTIIKQKSIPQSYLLVSNGELMEDMMKDADCDEEWLKKQLENYGYSDLKKLLCVEWTPERGFYLIDMEGNIINKIDSKNELNEE